MFVCVWSPEDLVTEYHCFRECIMYKVPLCEVIRAFVKYSPIVNKLSVWSTCDAVFLCFGVKFPRVLFDWF